VRVSQLVRVVAITAAGIAVLTARTPAQAPTMEEVLARAADYTTRFVENFSNLVATEKYIQDVRPANTALRLRWKPVPGSHRELLSDFLLLNVGGPLEWRPYRDVYMVDRKPVRDRNDRLMKLFTEPAATRAEQAARIAHESARHNIGLTTRTVNTPVLSLLFLQANIQDRFEFKIVQRNTGTDRHDVVLEYHEDFRPTLVRGTTSDDDIDLPASGRFWIHPDTGRVSRATLVVSSDRMRTELSTTYRDDPRFGIALPVEMRETIEVDRTLVTGTATYDNFRKFEVKTETVTKQDPRESKAPR
jgi:hypothetical protein